VTERGVSLDTSTDPDGPTLAQIAASGDHSRLSIVAAEGNTPSLRIAESLGFSRYGTEHRTAHLADGTVTDHHLYERLR
jgi:RimJ/RimL family protein N-acetyltransferase